MNKLDKLKDAYEKMGKKIEALESKENQNLYIPKIGGMYFFLDSCVDVLSSSWEDDAIDLARLCNNSVYEKAEHARSVANAKNKIHEIIGDWVPDWGDGSTEKYFNSFNHKGGFWHVGARWSSETITTFYYPTEEKAIEAQKWEEVIRLGGQV